MARAYACTFGNKTSNDFVYDSFGNMITDKNKSITAISYNHLNLPYKVTFANGGNISFVYDATGTRLSKKVQPSGGALVTTDYVNIFHHENNALKFFKQAEGFVEYKNNQYIYNYIYKDHLGNNRLVYADLDGNGIIDPATEIIEENNYYPFGLKHKGYNELSTENPAGHKYKYNGKEFQDELGLNWYSYGFRMYDPALGRFPSIDPISSQFPHVSPYNYAENEPVSSIDLWGLQRWIVNGRERNNPMPKWRTNARTAGFAIRHPKAAYKIGTGGRGSTDITGVAGRYARHFAESTGTSKAIGSKSNALRHVIWSSAIRSEFDAGISKRATNAHEGVGIAENQSVDFSKTFNGKGDDGLNLADHIVDVLNNEIGFSLAESNPDATIGELATIALTEFKENGLWTASADKDGNITITRTKLSEEEYEKALNHFNTLNENGFTREEQQEIDKK